MKKLSFLGIGPKIAVVFLPWLAVTIVASILYKDIFVYTHSKNKIILVAGILFMAFALIFYFSTVRLLLSGLKETKLVTKGSFALCQNPLYMAIILLIVPALSLILNSWLVLTSSLAGYLMMALYIKDEYSELEHFFGEEYLKYKKETPEFFPLRLRKSSQKKI